MHGSYGHSERTDIPREVHVNVQQAERVIAVFNTWAYKREQPSNASLLRTSAEAAILRKRPLPFVLYWGKGPRRHAAGPERDCLKFLRSMLDRIVAIYPPGAALELLLTDTHAKLNNHSQPAIDDYFTAIRAEAGRCGFSTRLLSSLMASTPLTCSEKYRTLPSEQTLSALIASAAKWYGGTDTPREAALAYYAMNMREKAVVEKFYEKAIFITFNGSNLSALFPDKIPIFYMYSVRKGCAVKPWFMPAPEDIKTIDNTKKIEIPVNQTQALYNP
jgi:L-tyrosine isonitrile synthase